MASADRPAGRRGGRPPGPTQNRGAILASARREFFERGYEGTSIRRIAAGAGVDPALVHHYFGSKDSLLVAALAGEGPDDLAGDEAVARLLEGGLEGLGARVVRALLEVYDTLDGGGPAADASGARWRNPAAILTALLRSAGVSDHAAALLRERFARGGLALVLRALRVPEPEVRTALLGSVVAGLVVARFVIRLEPVASADVETLAAWYGPTVQRLLVGPLGGGEGSGTGVTPVSPGP